MSTKPLIAVIVAIAGLAVATPITYAQREAAREPAQKAGKDVESLPIRRITLYRSGVGSFERRGLIDGDASVQLRFNTDQINDILKSMIVLDLSRNGRIDGISYGSKDPLSRRLSSFAVDISDNPTLVSLLARLRGTEATVSLAEGPVSGVILGTESRMEAMGDAQQLTPVFYLNLVTEEGIRSIKLSLASAVELKDRELNTELARALSAVAEYRADRTKTVDVNLRGEGAREIMIGYVQEAPVWKSSYRLVLPDDPSKKQDKDEPKPKAGDKTPAQPSGAGRLTIQGWAIVENTTDNDWKDVTLSLVSGRPVSFRMDLYEPLYVFRPEVPVPTVPGVMPRAYAGGVDGDRLRLDAPPPPAAAPADREASGGVQERRFAGSARARFADAAEAERAKAVSSEDMANYAATAQARAVEAGEVFQFEVDHPVTVERQRSAMIPIIASGIEGRRVSIFNPADGSEHPMRGVELTNSTGLQLMPGPISVFDGGAYAGDSQIGHVPAGDKRLLAYAVDLDMTHTRNENWTDTIRKVRIVKGLLELTTQRQSKVGYAFTNKDTARARTLIVEQPKMEGWTLTKPEKPYETATGLYRFDVAVDAGKSAALEVQQERTDATTIGITSIDLPTLLSYSRQGQVSEKVIDAFKEAARRQGLIVTTERQIADLERERGSIDTDQNRIRQNMNSIDRASELYKRYMQKLTEQETRVEQLATALAAAREQLNSQRADFEGYVAGLNAE